MNSNTLVKRQNSPPPTDPLEYFPLWVQMLAGNYPNAKVSSATLEMWMLVFKDYDKDMMVRAIINCVKYEKWVPTVSVISGYVQSELLKLASANNPNFWETCPECGERVPDVTNCVACEDLAREWERQGREFASLEDVINE